MNYIKNSEKTEAKKILLRIILKPIISDYYLTD